MKLITLSTEQAPPISVPLRFFAVAPAFLLLVALMLTLSPGNPFANTHAPALIAEPWIWRHLWLHLCTLMAALLAPCWMIAAQLLMLCLLLQSLLLAYTLFSAIAIYRRTLCRLEQI